MERTTLEIIQDATRIVPTPDDVEWLSTQELDEAISERKEIDAVREIPFHPSFQELLLWASSEVPTIGEYGRGYTDARKAVLRMLKDAGVV